MVICKKISIISAALIAALSCYYGIKFFLFAISPIAAPISQASISKFSEPMVDGSPGLRISIKSERRCQIGDLDIIQRESQFGADDSFLLSLELIGSNPNQDDANISNFRLKMNNLSGEFNAVLPIPKESNSKLFGLFLCRNQNNSSSCAAKEVYDLNQVLSFYIPTEGVGVPAVEKRKEFAKKDKVYFFMPIIIKDGNIVVLNQAALAAGREGIVKALSPLSLQSNDTIVSRILEINSKLQSKIAVIGPNSIEIDLPKSDTDKCSE